MKKITQKIYTLYALVITFLLSTSTAYGEGNSGSGVTGTFENPIKASSIEELIAVLLSFVVKIGTIIAIFAIIYSGFLFIKAQGNPEGISKAKTTFLWVIIGALILVGAEVLSNVICNTAKELGAGAVC